MKYSQSLLPNFKQAPSDASVISHKLMIRAGLVKQLSSGLYSWLPLGYKVLKKVEKIVREEMDKSGAQEILMPMVQPAELWEKSGRIKDYGPELAKFIDRNEHLNCLGPTHEEVVSDIAGSFVKSYKQLPFNLYQIQTKFRDEVRPRFGVLRAREFIMKDAYSFHENQQSLEETYKVMYQTYCNIFNRLGLNYKIVLADSGAIGGNKSNEFHVLAETGEDTLVFTEDDSEAMNVEVMQCIDNSHTRKNPAQEVKKMSTLGCISVDEGAKALNIKSSEILKLLLVKGKNNSPVALVIRGDYQINEIKAQKHPLVASPLEFLDKNEIEKLGLSAGSIGPYQLKEKFAIEVIADYSALAMSDFAAGANEKGFHYVGLNWDRDIQNYHKADLRQVCEGDIHPTSKKELKFAKGIEVGHIFQLGDKYSKAMDISYLDKNGVSNFFMMGCYGIGVSRIVAAAIEQSYDEYGIVWQKSLSPFDLVIVSISPDKSEAVEKQSHKIYEDAKKIGLEPLLIDGNDSFGAKLAMADLMGIPEQIIIGKRGLENNEIEVQNRKEKKKQTLSLDSLQQWIEAIKKDLDNL